MKAVHRRMPVPLIGAVVIVIAAIVIYTLVSNRHPIAYTVSYIEIIEIGQDDEHPWAMVRNPYDPNAAPFKLKLDTINTSHLLVVGNTYLASYETNTGTKKSVLSVIKQPAQP